jgi:hypothetical protein
MKKLLISLVSVGLAVGCGDVPTGTDGPTPNFGVAGNSGCATVSGAIDFVFPFGTLSGDVIGTVENVPGPAVVHGKVVFRPVEQTWKVTGGIVQPLIGRTLVFENAFRGTLAHLPLIGVHTTMRLVEGAQKGNLTLHGTTDLSTGTAHLEYHGVICP